MKKIILLTVILSSILLTTSCKSSQGHCDAYGSKGAESNDLEFDVYKVHNDSMGKYVTTTSLK